MRAVLCPLQFGRMLWGRQQLALCLERRILQGLFVSPEKEKKHLSWHMCCAF